MAERKKENKQISSAEWTQLGETASNLALAFDATPEYDEANILSDIVGFAGTGAGVGTMFGGPFGTAIGAGVGAIVGIGKAIFSSKEDKKAREEIERKRREAQKKAYEEYRDQISTMFESKEIQALQQVKQEQLRFGDQELGQLVDEIRAGAAKFQKLTGDISTGSSRLQLQREAQRTEGRAAIQARVSGIEDSIRKTQDILEFSEETQEELEDLEGKSAADASKQRLKDYQDLLRDLYG